MLFFAPFMLQMVMAGNGIVSKSVGFGLREMIIGLSSQRRYRIVMKYAAARTPRTNAPDQNNLKKSF